MQRERRTLRMRWERVADVPLTAAAVLFLAAYAWPVLDPGLEQPWRGLCHTVNLLTWVFFGLDYAVRVVLADRRSRYVLTHLVDLLVLVLPLLRPLRLLRLVTLLGVLNRHAAGSLRGRVALYITGATMFVVFCASLAVLQAERGRAGARIETFGDAAWWSLATISTVGYGDFVPVTVTGRLVAVALMLCGIALLGTVTAALASWLVDRVRDVDVASQSDGAAATHADLLALTAEVTALREELRRQEPGTQSAPDP